MNKPESANKTKRDQESTPSVEGKSVKTPTKKKEKKDDFGNKKNTISKVAEDDHSEEVFEFEISPLKGEDGTNLSISKTSGKAKPKTKKQLKEEHKAAENAEM